MPVSYWFSTLMKRIYKANYKNNNNPNFQKTEKSKPNSQKNSTFWLIEQEQQQKANTLYAGDSRRIIMQKIQSFSLLPFSDSSALLLQLEVGAWETTLDRSRWGEIGRSRSIWRRWEQRTARWWAGRRKNRGVDDGDDGETERGGLWRDLWWGAGGFTERSTLTGISWKVDS